VALWRLVWDHRYPSLTAFFVDHRNREQSQFSVDSIPQQADRYWRNQSLEPDYDIYRWDLRVEGKLPLE
ncbi:unnamed protein product, partial [Rodentolepis nana]|uniref:SAM-dependent methyltransferase n=1 Tax=Rodentolepis nana TaxID=102285 RepID=A0A0R3THW7_RODNA